MNEHLQKDMPLVATDLKDKYLRIFSHGPAGRSSALTDEQRKGFDNYLFMDERLGELYAYIAKSSNLTQRGAYVRPMALHGTIEGKMFAEASGMKLRWLSEITTDQGPSLESADDITAYLQEAPSQWPHERVELEQGSKRAIIYHVGDGTLRPLELMRCGARKPTKLKDGLSVEERADYLMRALQH